MELLLPFVLAQVPEAAIQQACALARPDRGRVTALVGVSLYAPNATSWNYAPAGTCDTLEEIARGALCRQLVKVQHRFDQETAQREIRVSTEFWLTPAENTLRISHCTDMVVLGASRPVLDVEARLFAGVIAASGRPVMMVPSGAAIRSFDRVLIAWNATQEAARAVHDALPLLQRARQVDILTVEPTMRTISARTEAADLLGAHLGRHGIATRVVHRQRALGSVSQRILEQANDGDADLIVCGAYGHPRALEHIVGGTTRSLLERSPVPVLFSR